MPIHKYIKTQTKTFPFIMITFLESFLLSNFLKDAFNSPLANKRYSKTSYNEKTFCFFTFNTPQKITYNKLFAQVKAAKKL